MKTIQKKTTGYKEENLKEDILKNISTGGSSGGAGAGDPELHIIGDKPKKIYCKHNNYESIASTTAEGVLTNLKLYSASGLGNSIGATLVQDVKHNDVDYYYVDGTAFASGSGAPAQSAFISDFKNYIQEPDNLQPITSIYLYKYNGSENCIINVANFKTNDSNFKPTIEFRNINTPSDPIYEE